MKTLRIGTRKSQLALWQAEYIRGRLLDGDPTLHIELVKMTTQGDKILDTPLAKVGGKGLFIKELEQGLLDGHIDLAVHSTKDMTMHLPPSLHIGAICMREDPRDALVSNTHSGLESLPTGARVGTSSLRRQCQLKAAFPHLTVSDLRGNVNTRLAKLDADEFDAIMLAAAGLKRLGFDNRIASYLEIEQILPAVGQGAICIECRADDTAINALVATLNHRPTQLCVMAERAMNERLQGGCQVPIGGYAVLSDEMIHLRGLVGSLDGSTIIRAEKHGPEEAAEQLGIDIANELLAKGARAILDDVYDRA